MKLWKVLLCLAAIASFNGCMSSSPYSTTDTPEAGLSGTMVDAQGAPVADALVKAYVADTTGGVLSKVAASADTFVDTVALDSTWTNAKGQYNFPNLKDGNYNLEGTLYQNGDTLVVSHREIHFNGAVNLGPDTLKAPGLILIEAQWNGEPIPGVHCTLVNGSQAAVSDDSGRCLIAHVPPGVFQVQLSQGGYFPDTSGNIRVYSNQFTDAGILTLTQLPDSAKGCWNLQQSNGYYAILSISGAGVQTTDSAAWYSKASGEYVGPGAGTGTDSASSVYFDQNYPGTSDIGYYWATVKGDSLINGTSKSSEGDQATWFATRIVCPD